MRRAAFTHWLGRLSLVICALLVGASPMPAQDTGQVCVQSFDDRDGDGARDADEGAIAHGVGASLQNPDGLTIAARLLEDSPFATDGLLCFDDLLAGDYQLRLSSAEFRFTTSASFATTVAPGRAPPLYELGLKPLFEPPSSRGRSATALDAAGLTALLPVMIGGLAALALIGLGCLLAYVFVFRRRRAKPAPPPYPAAASRDAPDKHEPGAGSPPLFNGDETEASPPERSDDEER